MDYFRNFYGNPNQFGNWQQYAGMDPGKGFYGGVAPPAQPAQQGVEPPSTLSEYATQQIGQVKNRFESTMGNLSNAASQVGQGNLFQAARAAGGMAPQPPASPQLPSIVEDIYDYSKMVGQ